MPYLTSAQEMLPGTGRASPPPRQHPPAGRLPLTGEESPDPTGAITFRQAAVCVETCSSVDTGANYRPVIIYMKMCLWMNYQPAWSRETEQSLRLTRQQARRNPTWGSH